MGFQHNNGQNPNLNKEYNFQQYKFFRQNNQRPSSFLLRQQIRILKVIRGFDLYTNNYLTTKHLDNLNLQI